MLQSQCCRDILTYREARIYFACNRTALDMDSSALEESCPDYWEVRLPEAQVPWGMVSLQDTVILLLSWRAAIAEFCCYLKLLS